MTQTLTIDSGTLVVDDLLPPWSSMQTITGGSSGSPGMVSRASVWTVISVALGSQGSRVQLSSDFQIGDLVEILDADGNGPKVIQVSSFETITNGGNTNAVIYAPRFLRKVSSSVWSANPGYTTN